MNIDALIISVDDPQLEKCLYAVKYQTVPFSNIVHLNNVCPMHEAFNQGMAKTAADWVMFIGGDMILDLNAVGRIAQYIEKDAMEHVSGYWFGLLDTFFDCRIGFIGVLYGPLYRTIKYWDSSICDLITTQRLRREGWIVKKNLRFVVGTHFDSPNEEQVFKRCYIHGIRFPYHKSLEPKLLEMFNKTQDPLYLLGIDAINYAREKKYYPGSHNIEFDKRNYEEWKRLSA